MRLLDQFRPGGLKSFSEPNFWEWADRLQWSAPRSSPDRESIEASFDSYINDAYKASGVVAACITARQFVFSEARFQYRRFVNGRPQALFGDASLALLENPWPGGTTGELLGRMEVDASLAGNFYATVADDAGNLGRAATGSGRRVVRMRPDWVTLIISSRSGDPYALDARVVAYEYQPPVNSRTGKRLDPVMLLPSEVCHYSPMPDPAASFRGMSWLTPVVREIAADQAATKHKLNFFKNGATLQTVIGLPTGISKEQFDKFVEMTGGAHDGVDNAYKTLYTAAGADVTVVGANMQQLDFKVTQGAGEPLALDTPIPTPSGWTTMGEIAEGDQVIGSDGLPVRVVGVSPVHIGRDCYRVTFNDRTSVVADAGHLWAAIDRNTADRAVRTYTTQQLADMITEWSERGNGGNRIGIPPLSPVKLPDQELLVDPYVLGAWLGDGQTAGAAICGADDDLEVIAAEIERRGYTTTRWATAPDKVAVIGIPGGLLAALRAIGVLGDKKIPDDYMRASIEQRLDLLRGLMDTDGSVGVRGKETCEFSSKHEALARQVAELVRSLGMRCTFSRKVDVRSRTGEICRVTFRADPEMVPFLLPRKVARCVTPLHVKNRAIVSIERVESVPVRCIAVDSADHLFAAGEGWVLTHNTRIAAAARVHPVVVGLSEGLAGSSLNAGNYQAARRAFADGTMRPLWRMAAASLQNLVTPPDPGASLWYDDRDVAFLREDAKDQAEIQFLTLQAIRQAIEAGFDPNAAVAYAETGDLSTLTNQHTGLVSVQLQEPGAGAPTLPGA